MENIINIVSKFLVGPPPQRDIKLEEKRMEVKHNLMELVAEGNEIDGVLCIFSKHGQIVVMQGGLGDDFEAGVFLRRAEYLVNSQGLIK